jgi:NADPH2:quinone reductase
MLHNYKREEHGAILKELSNIAQDKALVPLVDSTFALDNVGDAYARLESGKAIGKVVVTN